MADRYSHMSASDFDYNYGYSIRYLPSRSAAIVIKFFASNNANNTIKDIVYTSVLNAIDIALEDFDAFILPVVSFDVVRMVMEENMFTVCALLEFRQESDIKSFETSLRQNGVIL